MSVLADEKPPTLSAGEGQKAVARAASIIDFNLVERVNGMGSENGGSQMITQGGNSDDGTSESCDGKVERACRKEVTMVTQKSRKKTKAGRYTSDITYEEMQQYFHLPGEKAAKELGVGKFQLQLGKISELFPVSDLFAKSAMTSWKEMMKMDVLK